MELIRGGASFASRYGGPGIGRSLDGRRTRVVGYSSKHVDMWFQRKGSLYTRVSRMVVRLLSILQKHFFVVVLLSQVNFGKHDTAGECTLL